MESDITAGLAAILVIGIAAQWFGWRFGIPSILLLLIAGLAVGATGFIDPDGLFGDLLFPMVSLSVAVILFEGGLSLKYRELRDAGRAVLNLVTIGVFITWVLAALAAWLIFDIDIRMAVLLGAVLTVTGPTVIGPLLRHIRPSGSGATALKWEGNLNDPVGALLAVLVFEAIVSEELGGAAGEVAVEVLKAVGIGVLAGGLGAAVAVFLQRKFLAPDFLQEVIVLALVVAAFTIADSVVKESGLLAVTLMGIAMANQKFASIKHIVEFKENLRVILISFLFVILAARVELQDLQDIAWQSAVFVAVLILVVRPLSVSISTFRTALTWKDRVLLAWMAPRGIVAAAVAAVFAIGLSNAGFERADDLVSIMFIVIIGTVLIYGLTVRPLAILLGLATRRSEGTVIIGAHAWAIEIAKKLKECGAPVILLDTDREKVAAAKASGLEAFFTSAISDSVFDEVDLQEMARLIAVTSNDELNSLACLHFSEAFSRTEVYQLMVGPSAGDMENVPVSELRGRILFNTDLTYAKLAQQFQANAKLVSTEFSDQLTFEQFREQHPEAEAIPLFVLRSNQELDVFTVREKHVPRSGDTLIWLALPAPTSDKKTHSESRAAKEVEEQPEA